jgi:zinc protease
VPLPAVALSWLAPPATSDDGAALQVVAALLSGGESSRLNQTLVYRKRVASDAGFNADLRAGPGLLTAYAIAAGGRRLPALQAALRAEVQALAQRPPGAAELAKVKTQLLTQALVERETPRGLGSALAEAAVLEGGAERVNRKLDALQAVTAADVQRVVRQYLIRAHHVTLEYTQEGAAR